MRNGGNRLIQVLSLMSVLIAFAMLRISTSEASQIRVSSFGKDTPTCGTTVFDACRTLQHGVDRANAGDTVYLDLVGDYGPATIAKTINIIGAADAGIYSPADACLTINGAIDDIVTVTNLTCDQAGAARHGIVFNSGHRLRLVDVRLTHGGSGACGVRFQPNTNAEFDFFNVHETSWGTAANCIFPRAGADVTGVIANAGMQDDLYGIRTSAPAGSLIAVSCDECRISGGTVGILSSGAGSTVRIKNCLITENGTGLSHPNDGAVVSNGGNSIIGNTVNGTVTATAPPT